MAGTADVIRGLSSFLGVHYPVLVPNQKGLDMLHALLSQNHDDGKLAPPIDEISVFTAATDAFNRANLNMTTAESLSRLAPVIRNAQDMGLRVRGYVSVVISCPFSGKTDPRKVAEVSKELIDMVS